MKISTKGQYAMRMMMDLAINNTGEYTSIKSIAQRQNLPEKYLEQIMTVLVRSGYVKSVRGAKGGYRLANSPKEYTVGMILQALEGSLAPVACFEEKENGCSQGADCVTCEVTCEVWQELDDAIHGVVDNITLEDLVIRHNSYIGNDYVI